MDTASVSQPPCRRQLVVESAVTHAPLAAAPSFPSYQSMNVIASEDESTCGIVHSERDQINVFHELVPLMPQIQRRRRFPAKLHGTKSAPTIRSDRPRSGRWTARSTILVSIVLIVCLGTLMVWSVGPNTPYAPSRAVWPTRHELALVEHYASSSSLYGTNDMAPWWRIYHSDQPLQILRDSWRFRRAQFVADTAQREQLSRAASTTANPVFDRRPGRRLRRSLQRNKHRSHGTTPNTASQPHDGCETTVVLMRHCEKGSIVEHCAYQGYERSVYLASLFGTTPDARWPAPSYIFAESPPGRVHGHKMNFREVETVGPLADAAGITVDDSYSDGTRSDLSAHVLHAIRDGTVCGQVVVIVWKHTSIAHLARNLGCGPTQGCPLDYSGKTFDQIWEIKLVYRTWEHSTHHKTFVHDDDHVRPNRPSWMVFGSIQYENFDPLAVSKQFGDYPPGGTTVGGRWEAKQVAYPERTRKKDRDGWKKTHVSIP